MNKMSIYFAILIAIVILVMTSIAIASKELFAYSVLGFFVTVSFLIFDRPRSIKY